MHKSEIRRDVLRARKDVEKLADAIDAEDLALGAALMEVGLAKVLGPFLRIATASDKAAVRVHFPEATDAAIDAHSLTPNGIDMLLSYLVTLARKYLDHQPGTSAANVATPDDEALHNLVTAVTRQLNNAFASAGSLGVSAYDVAATAITNASVLAAQNGVPLEQLAVIHLEGISERLGGDRSK